MDWDSYWMINGGTPTWALRYLLTMESWAQNDDNQPMRVDYGTKS